MRRSQTRQIRRLQRAIDELIKILDDGHGNADVRYIIDALNAEIAQRLA